MIRLILFNSMLIGLETSQDFVETYGGRLHLGNGSSTGDGSFSRLWTSSQKRGDLSHGKGRGQAVPGLRFAARRSSD
jgi:hypothetical protein